MNKLKKQFKKDFEKSQKVNLSFDVTQLETNSRRKFRIIPRNLLHIEPRKLVLIGVALAIVSAIAIPVSISISSSLVTKESVKLYNRKYTLNEIALAESNTFKKINNITYPSGVDPVSSSITNEEKNAYNNFSNLTYHSLVDTSKKDNMSYSVVGLYSVMNELTNAISRDELKIRFNNLLGLNEEDRVAFYDKVMKANSFARDESTIQLKNAAFFNDRFMYNQTFVDSLSNLYCEAYQLSFLSELNKIVEWANKATNTNNFIDKEFLEMDDETELYLLSAFYFKNAWSNKYLSNNNVVDDFYLENGNTEKVEYMKHSYQTNKYYDYGAYISFKDYYYRGAASITYLVPKKSEDSIFELTKNVNIFEENEDKAIKNIQNNYTGLINVNVMTPKFTTKGDIDFQKGLENLGFADIFNRMIDSFKNAFSGEAIADYNTCIQKIKQRNEVEFNEDGSIIKTLTMASVGAPGSSAPTNYETLDVSLNQPFIYIIRDVNDTPVFVGHVDNPSIT